jgi:hypothetical protein
MTPKPLAGRKPGRVTAAVRIAAVLACVLVYGHSGAQPIPLSEPELKAVSVDPCKGNTCSGHGSCAHGKCYCVEGFSGDRCQNAADPCAGNTCSDHGKCVLGKCFCIEGFSGDRCQNAVDPCAGNTCSGHGSCVQGKCFCVKGFSGDRCQNAVDPCTGNTCSGHGSCVQGKCFCIEGYTGPACQTAIAGPCFGKPDGLYCASTLAGYLGSPQDLVRCRGGRPAKAASCKRGCNPVLGLGAATCK